MSESRMKLPMFDDYWIDFRIGTTRRWFQPERHSLCPSGLYTSLISDEERGVYRIYYESKITPEKDGPRHLKLLESRDLIHFEPVMGSDGTDVICHGETGVHGCTVLYDRNDPDPARRYKFCGMTRMGRKGMPKEVEIAFSADGIHWDLDHKIIAHPFTSDTRNSLLYNPITEEYTLFHRSAHVDRRISIKHSKDLIHWTDPQIVLHPGPSYSDGFTGVQHYAMGVNYMDGIFYGLLWDYQTCLYGDDFLRMYGYYEPELVYSYDGKEFLRTSGRPLIDRPMPPEPGCAGLAPHDMCLSLDGKDYYIICGGAFLSHATQEQTNAAIAAICAHGPIKRGSPIYKIRRDGFCGLESVCPGGKVITKPLSLLKDDLTFNLRANTGSAHFGIMDRDGAFLEGFSFDDCIPFEYGDGIEVTPKWKSHKLSEVLGRRIRIAVELNTAILHCVSATARPHIRQAQKSFAQPWGIDY